MDGAALRLPRLLEFSHPLVGGPVRRDVCDLLPQPAKGDGPRFGARLVDDSYGFHHPLAAHGVGGAPTCRGRVAGKPAGAGGPALDLATVPRPERPAPSRERHVERLYRGGRDRGRHAGGRLCESAGARSEGRRSAEAAVAGPPWLPREQRRVLGSGERRLDVNLRPRPGDRSTDHRRRHGRLRSCHRRGPGGLSPVGHPGRHDHPPALSVRPAARRSLRSLAPAARPLAAPG